MAGDPVVRTKVGLTVVEGLAGKRLVDREGDRRKHE